MADASIVIDTKLDNKGFQSGSAQMRKAVNGLQSTFDDFGRKAEGSINAMAPALQNAAQKAQELSSSLSETEFQRSMDHMASACEKLDAKIISLRQRAEQGFTSEAQAQKWRSDLQSVQQEAANLQQQLSELGSRSVKANSLVEMEAEAEKLEQKLFNLYDKRDNMRDLGADEITEETLNEDELSEVLIIEHPEEGDDIVTAKENLVNDGILHWTEGYLFNLRDMTDEEKTRAELDARISFLEMMGGWDE